MATYWVSSSAKGAADGSSYADAVGTLPAGIALCTAKGDILNVINDGDHTWPTSETDLPAGTKGTSFSDYGTLIRGVADSAVETPEVASVVASGGDAARYFVRVIADTGYAIVRNLEFDASGKTADTFTYYASRLRDTGSPDPGPIRLEGCAFIGGATGVAPTGVRLAYSTHASSPPAGSELFEILDCYFQNWITAASAGATLEKTFQGCVFYNDVQGAGGSTFFSQTLASGSGGAFGFIGNTIFQDIGNSVFGAPLNYTVSGAFDAGTVNVKDNLVFLESTSAGPGAHFMADAGPATGSFSGTIDYNVLLGGPNVAAGDLHPEAWYHDLWDVSPANDQYAYEQATASVFFDPSSAYDWDPLNNGATISILKDLRPRLYTAASESGGAVGALPPGETDLTVTNASDRSSPKVDETVIFTVTASNSGSDDSNVEVDGAVPSGLTFVGAVVTVGSYDSGTGIWTIGDLDDAASATLTLTVTVDSDQAGNTINYTATISGDLDETNSGDNTATATLSVVADDVDDPGGDAVTPVIDTYPLYKPDLQFNLNMRLQLKKNRVREFYLGNNVEGQRWLEMLSRQITLSTNTTTTVNLGGIQRAEFMLVESDEPVQVGVGNASVNLYPASKVVALVGTDFEMLQIKNPSLTTEANILVVVTD